MSDFGINKFKTKPREYVTRDDGRCIEVETLKPKTPARRKRQPWDVRFTQLPEFWRGALEKIQSAATWHLAHRTLREVYVQQNSRWPKPVVLSASVTGLAATSRQRATQNMLRLKLFSIEQRGKQAAVVTKLFLGGGEVIDLRRQQKED